MKTYQLALACCALLATLSCSGSGREDTADPDVSDQGTQANEKVVVTDEKLVLATLPDNFREGSLAFSDDGKHIAYVVRTDTGQQVLNGDGPLADTTAQQCSRPKFSPKSDKIFYWALDTSSGNQAITLVADGTPITTEFASEGALTFSSDGRRWVAVGGTPETREGDKIIRGPKIVILDGTEIGRYPDMSEGTPETREGDKIIRGPTIAILDGTEIGRYPDMSDPAADVDGEPSRLAWW